MEVSGKEGEKKWPHARIASSQCGWDGVGGVRDEWAGEGVRGHMDCSKASADLDTFGGPVTHRTRHIKMYSDPLLIYK